VFRGILVARDYNRNAQRELHWLPIEQRIKSAKICEIVHSVVADTAPEYIILRLGNSSACLKLASALTGTQTIGSAATEPYDVPCTRNLMGSKVFSVASPTAWKNLPS